LAEFWKNVPKKNAKKSPMVITRNGAFVAAIKANEKWDTLRIKGPMTMTMRLPKRSAKYPEKGEPMIIANPITGKINPTVDRGIPRIVCK